MRLTLETSSIAQGLKALRRAPALPGAVRAKTALANSHVLAALLGLSRSPESAGEQVDDRY
ncbi:hypothetical protein EMIT0373P_50401 [Pseudomonas chlororaphis]